MKPITAKTAQANCSVLDTENDLHVTRQTPLDTKRRDLKEANTGENPVRVREVNRRRADKTGVRPL